MSYILITLAADISIFQVVAHNLQPKWMDDAWTALQGVVLSFFFSFFFLIAISTPSGNCSGNCSDGDWRLVGGNDNLEQGAR